VIREVLIVPETKPAKRVIAELRKSSSGHGAGCDEFGSIPGISHWRYLEQVVGITMSSIVRTHRYAADGAVIFERGLNVRSLDAQYNITLPEDPAYARWGDSADQLASSRGGEALNMAILASRLWRWMATRGARQIERILSFERRAKDWRNWG